MLSIAELRCVNRELSAGLLRFWFHGIPVLSDFFLTIEHQILLFHYFAVVLLVEVLRLFVQSRSISGPVAE